MDNGVYVHYVGQMHVLKQGPRKLYFRTGELLEVTINATLQLAKALRQSDADIVQICKPQPMNSLAARIGAKGRPIFCDCDDYEAETNLFTNPWQKRIVEYFEDGIINYVNGITVNTRFSLNRYISLGYAKENIIYVPNGVERIRFSAQPDPERVRKQWGLSSEDLIVLYIGTLGIQSHPIDLLLEAFSQVVKIVPNARLLLVGGGEDYDFLNQKATQLGINAHTIFTGRIPPQEIPDYITAATVSIDPVRNDLIARARSPLKILESLVLGTPVVTSDVGERRVLLNEGKFGILVSPGDSSELENGILEILKQPELRLKMSTAALQNREQWFWDNLTDQYINIYRKEKIQDQRG
jgi:glycosyltransferase involved in cell wall biosynthesis